MAKVLLTESQRECERLKRNLKLMQGSRSYEEMGKIIGISKGTYHNRLKNPESLNLKEVRKMCAYFKISPSVFIAEELKIQ